MRIVFVYFRIALENAFTDGTKRLCELPLVVALVWESLLENKLEDNEESPYWVYFNSYGIWLDHKFTVCLET